MTESVRMRVNPGQRRFRIATIAATAASTAVVLAVTAFAFVYFFFVPDADDAVEAFIAYGQKPGEFVSEEMLLDPLFAARGDVVPEVIAAVGRPDLPKRRYAITFLGMERRREALPILRKILDDPIESAIFRGDALDAISMIDVAEGRQRAAPYVERTDHLGATAEAIVKRLPRALPSSDRAVIRYLCVRLAGC